MEFLYLNDNKELGLRCDECKKVFRINENSFKSIDSQKAILKDGIRITCGSCGNIHTWKTPILHESMSTPDNNPQTAQLFIPKCPTCGTTNVRKIGTSTKAANAVAFGLLGNKRKMQFECLNPNCRYMW